MTTTATKSTKAVASAAASMDDLPHEVLFAQICTFVHLRDRWFGLALVSRKWRQLAIASAHNERHVDLVRPHTSTLHCLHVWLVF